MAICCVRRKGGAPWQINNVDSTYPIYVPSCFLCVSFVTFHSLKNLFESPFVYRSNFCRIFSLETRNSFPRDGLAGNYQLVAVHLSFFPIFLATRAHTHTVVTPRRRISKKRVRVMGEKYDCEMKSARPRVQFAAATSCGKNRLSRSRERVRPCTLEKIEPDLWHLRIILPSRRPTPTR